MIKYNSLPLIKKIYTKKTPEEIRTINVALFSTLLLESGIICDFLRSRREHFLTYVFLSMVTVSISIFLILLWKFYEYLLLKRCELITYIVREGDSLIAISQTCMPECNPWKTASLIRNINNIKDFIYVGQKILVPSRL
ncbi:hypothetical protein BJV85_000996 [Clostridium acetobutylicum]|uniref:LysM repeats domain containing membrane protein n=1 Tax=Clostridium acetobutylicum (strain ATCC 824 / DSM 792 / JCM 1419 / IAM 19013 / LMG 5710 / NBRC 13948 / NRRL B-527 / VKM B-1787 / 2291 / W) TaxID=272562 RepID=Q97F54_CLOAB|nr:MULTISPECIES: LysM peptidoglycan-binding domain-containing protein [Clostridium]AAK80841.1 LysM repeats domain containing membrane protein [Clostridium acetobutylicum ATCC 824]ADZ21943.1 LysM repeats domain containing membrane protein [Clostridium acetobutylicum EA 2018]AEI32599.1 LysM repeat-containing protein [Clostridium acetobutylicum DSM 1731]AWV78747.1 LysM peptidoglycan-binding domain-containing protein [Clostridium acetobutylicum]KHD37203.1 peptidoglycan-binding protein LysM [Clostr